MQVMPPSGDLVAGAHEDIAQNCKLLLHAVPVEKVRPRVQGLPYPAFMEDFVGDWHRGMGDQPRRQFHVARAAPGLLSGGGLVTLPPQPADGLHHDL